MNVSRILLSDCLNLSMFGVFFSALSTSAVKAQMLQWGHLRRHSVAVRGDSVKLLGYALPHSSWPFYLFGFPLCGIVHEELHRKLKLPWTCNTKIDKNSAVTFIRRWKSRYHTLSRHAAFRGHDMPLDSCSFITGQHHKLQSSAAPHLLLNAFLFLIFSFLATHRISP